jgi:hypothetical protein
MEDDKPSKADPRSQPAFAIPRWFSLLGLRIKLKLWLTQPVPVSLMQMDNFDQIREALESFALAPASEPLLNNLTEFPKVNAEFMVFKALGPNGVPNTV